MRLLTAQQMRALDRIAIERYGVPSLDLMERAGRGVAEYVRRRLAPPGPVAIVAGKGNNAGDGFVAARYLAEAGYAVRCFLAFPLSEFAPDAAANWHRLSPSPNDVGVTEIFDARALATHRTALAEARYILDALVGTGLSKPVTPHLRACIEWLNQSGRPVIAIDIPSGLSADTGQPMDIAVRACATVTLGCAKVGLVVAPGYEYAGAIEVVDIGIPSAAEAAVTTPYFLTTVADVARSWPRRAPADHKGRFGHCLVIAGSLEQGGAGLLASRAALRSGAGLVTYALPAAAYAKFDPAAAEVMLEPLPDDGSGRLQPAAAATLKKIVADKTAVVLGPGLGIHEATQRQVARFTEQCPLPLVIDAAAIDGIAANVSVLRARSAATVLTPHPGEMARLVGKATAAVQADRFGTALAFAATHDVICVLKGYRTVVATPDGMAHVNPTGNVGMATAGAGDVLAGVIGALIAQGMPPTDAALAGVYVHGLAGDLAAERKGAAGMIASDIIEALPEAIRLVEAAMKASA